MSLSDRSPALVFAPGAAQDLQGVEDAGRALFPRAPAFEAASMAGSGSAAGQDGVALLSAAAVTDGVKTSVAQSFSAKPACSPRLACTCSSIFNSVLIGAGFWNSGRSQRMWPAFSLAVRVRALSGFSCFSGWAGLAGLAVLSVGAVAWLAVEWSAGAGWRAQR
jgi:hypothetical protein